MFKSLKKNMLKGGRGSSARSMRKRDKRRRKKKREAKAWKKIANLAEIGIELVKQGKFNLNKPKITGDNVNVKKQSQTNGHITELYARDVLEEKVKDDNGKELKKVNKWLNKKGMSKSDFLYGNRTISANNYFGLSQYMPTNPFSSAPLVKGGGKRTTSSKKKRNYKKKRSNPTHS